MFKKIKKEKLIILTTSLIFLFNFQNINAMQNLNDYKVNNISNSSNTLFKENNDLSKNKDLKSIINNNFDELKKQLKEIKAVTKNLKEFKAYIKNQKISKEDLQDEIKFKNHIKNFIDMKEKKYEENYKKYYKNKKLDKIGNKYMHENISNLHEFAKKIQDINTLKKYLNETLIISGEGNSIEKKIKEKCDNILYYVEEEETEKISKIFNKCMAKCEEINIDAINLLQWFTEENDEKLKN